MAKDWLRKKKKQKFLFDMTCNNHFPFKGCYANKLIIDNNMLTWRKWIALSVSFDKRVNGRQTLAQISAFTIITHGICCSAHGYCHESGRLTSFNLPSEVTRSLHGLLHYTNCCTPPQTTIPIIHCTDDTQLIALMTHST